MLPQRKGHVLGDRHAVEQRRLLKQEPEARPLPRQFALAQQGQIAAVEVDFAARRPHQPDDRLEHHRLAAAALADDRHRFAAGDLQIEAAQHLLVAELDVDAGQPHERGGSGRSSCGGEDHVVVKGF